MKKMKMKTVTNEDFIFQTYALKILLNLILTRYKQYEFY